MPTKNIKIRYSKSYDFKTSFVSGIYGGIASNGLINLNFFADRTVIPDSQNVDVSENGIQIGAPVEQKDGDLMREVFFGALMDVNTARVLIDWLEGRIKDHEAILKR